MGNALAWGRRNGNTISAEARVWFLRTIPDHFVACSKKYYKEYRDEYSKVFTDMIYKVIDYSYALYLNLVPRIGDRELVKQLEYHPHTFRTESKEVLQRKLREWIGEYKEELIAKSWHTSRFMTWCLDDEEKGEFQSDCNGDRIIIGERAAWNIPWG
jgi:hypothetical protein